jgi:hypothetical protein
MPCNVGSFWIAKYTFLKKFLKVIYLSFSTAKNTPPCTKKGIFFSNYSSNFFMSPSMHASNTPTYSFSWYLESNYFEGKFNRFISTGTKYLRHFFLFFPYF